MSPKRRRGPAKINTALRFYDQVLGLEHLHFGLFDGDPLTFEGLRSAQRRYAERLCEWIPPGVRAILDVGCGTGATARLLAERGYEVEGLAPDPHLQAEFVRRTGLPFHLSRFQDFAPGRAFDLVLMSESCQYVPLRALVGAVRRALPGGWLLVADFFRTPDAGAWGYKSGHDLAEFLAELAQGGLEIARECDITAETAPTLALARHVLDERIEPGLEIAVAAARSRHPLIAKAVMAVGRLALRKPLAELESLRQRLDPEAFQRGRRYMLYLVRVPAAAPVRAGSRAPLAAAASS